MTGALNPGTAPTLAETGEFGLIAELTADPPVTEEVLVGPGDDAALLAIEGPVLTSIDVLVEGVHFRRDWSSALDVGRKAVAVNVADIEAMGGRAIGIVVGFSAPPDLPREWARDLTAGIRQEGRVAGVSLVGGDVTRGRDVVISVSVLGVLDGRSPVLRSGAAAGQVVAVAGRLGWAAAGLAVLGRGFRSPRAVVEAYRVPSVPYGAGAAAAAAGATAMIDISDGLLADLGHVATASQVIIDVDATSLPVPEPLQAVASATGTDPLALILTGGEDHALAACFDSMAAVPAGWQAIGSIVARAEEPAVLVNGAPWPGAAGFDHFRSRR